MLRSVSKLSLGRFLNVLELKNGAGLSGFHTAVTLNYNVGRMKGEYDFPESNANVEISTAEWKYVERLMPMPYIPKPNFKPGEIAPSGWRAPKAKKDDHPYYVMRNRNHLLRIHLDNYVFDKIKILTKVKGIEGDIYQLGKELEEFLLEVTGRRCVAMRVAESFGTLTFKGDFYQHILDFLYEKGF